MYLQNNVNHMETIDNSDISDKKMRFPYLSQRKYQTKKAQTISQPRKDKIKQIHNVRGLKKNNSITKKFLLIYKMKNCKLQRQKSNNKYQKKYSKDQRKKYDDRHLKQQQNWKKMISNTPSQRCIINPQNKQLMKIHRSSKKCMSNPKKLQQLLISYKKDREKISKESLLLDKRGKTINQQKNNKPKLLIVCDSIKCDERMIDQQFRRCYFKLGNSNTCKKMYKMYTEGNDRNMDDQHQIQIPEQLECNCRHYNDSVIRQKAFLTLNFQDKRSIKQKNQQLFQQIQHQQNDCTDWKNNDQIKLVQKYMDNNQKNRQTNIKQSPFHIKLKKMLKFNNNSKLVLDQLNKKKEPGDEQFDGWKIDQSEQQDFYNNKSIFSKSYFKKKHQIK